MEVSRDRLLQDLVKFQKVIATKSNNGKLAMALKKYLEMYLQQRPQDAVLRQYYVLSTPVLFCDVVIDLLRADRDGPFPLDTPTGLLPVTETASSGTSCTVPHGAGLKKKRRHRRVGNPHPLIAQLLEELRKPKLDYTWEGEILDEAQLSVLYKQELNAVCPHVSSISELTTKCCEWEEAHASHVYVPLSSLLDHAWSISMSRFLPWETIRGFLLDSWDGTESGLKTWLKDHRLDPWRIILQEDTESPPENKRERMQPVLDYLCRQYRCGHFGRLTYQQCHRFLEWSLRYTQASPLTILHSMDLDRRTLFFDHVDDSKTSLSVPFPYWDLSWAPNLVSRTLVPLEPLPLLLTERRFASFYFDPSSRQQGDVFLWRGYLPFRVEYVTVGGTRVVQDEALYHQQCEASRTRSWHTPVATLPPREAQVLLRLCAQWITTSLSFLPSSMYDVIKMTECLMESIETSSSTLYDVIRRVYDIVGKLHPWFPLSACFNVFRERLRHCYFLLPRLFALPRELSWPEYHTLSVAKQASVDKMWEQHFVSFQQFLVSQWSQEQDGTSRTPPTTPMSTTLQLKVPLLDRNDHICIKDGARVWTTLDSVIPQYSSLLYDDDIVPHGMESLGVFVEYPFYLSNDTVPDMVEPEPEEEEDAPVVDEDVVDDDNLDNDILDETG